LGSSGKWVKLEDRACHRWGRALEQFFEWEDAERTLDNFVAASREKIKAKERTLLDLTPLGKII